MHTTASLQIIIFLIFSTSFLVQYGIVCCDTGIRDKILRRVSSVERNRARKLLMIDWIRPVWAPADPRIPDSKICFRGDDDFYLSGDNSLLIGDNTGTVPGTGKVSVRGDDTG
jgi:hypothetical protein